MRISDWSSDVCSSDLAAALERVEHAPDRAQALEVVGAFAPDRQHPVEVVDLLAELLEEHLADFLVDLVTGDFEADPAAGRDGDGRGDLRAVDLLVVGLGSTRLVDAEVDDPGAGAVDVVAQRRPPRRVRP